MKIRFFYIISIIFIVLLIYFLRQKNEINYIIKNKKELSVLKSDKQKVFILADKTLKKINSDKKDTQRILDSLTLEVMEKQNEMKYISSEIEKNKLENESLNLKKSELELLLTETKQKLEESIKNHENSQKTICEITEEKHNLERQIDYYVGRGEQYIIIDTIYQIDTIFYSSDDIKTLKLRKQ